MWLLCNRTKPVLWGILLLSTHVKSALMCFSSGAGGTGFELGDVSGSGEGGQRKERHSGLGREQFLYYTALTKCCHTKWASSCDFVFVGLLHRVTAQTSRHYRSSPAVSAIVLFLLTCPWGVVTNFALAGQHRGHPTCLESALFLPGTGAGTLCFCWGSNLQLSALLLWIPLTFVQSKATLCHIPEDKRVNMKSCSPQKTGPCCPFCPEQCGCQNTTLVLVERAD